MKQSWFRSVVLTGALAVTGLTGYTIYSKNFKERYNPIPYYVWLLTSAALPASVFLILSKKYSSKSIVENQDISAAIVNATISTSSILFYNKFPNELESFKHMMIPLATGSGVYTYFFLQNLSKFNRPYIKNWFKGLRFALKITSASIKKDTVELEKLILHESSKIYSNPNYYAQLATTELRKEAPDVENFIKWEKKSLTNEKQFRFDRRIIYPITQSLSSLIPNVHLSSALYAYRYNDENKFIKQFSKFLSNNPSIAAKASYVFALEAFLKKLNSSNLNEELASAWNYLIESILTEDFESIDNRKVYTVKIHDFLRTMLVLREGSKECLEQEIQNLSNIKRGFTEEYDVVEPVYIGEHNGVHYLVEKFAFGGRLTENLSRCALQKTIFCTKLMHESFEKKPAKEHIKRAGNKLESIRLPDHIKELFASSMAVLFKYAKDFTVFDCDAHPDNFFVGNSDTGRRIIVLDKPSRGYVLPEEDITKLVNGHSFYEQSEKDWNNKKEDICNWYNADESFFHSCASLTSYKALSYAAYATRSPIKSRNATAFLKNAVFDINMLMEELKPSGTECDSYNRIIDALEETQRIIA